MEELEVVGERSLEEDRLSLYPSRYLRGRAERQRSILRPPRSIWC